MPMNDIDEPAKQPRQQSPGDDLYDFSVEELRERIELFEAEITRTKQILAKKTAGMDVANALFGKS